MQEHAMHERAASGARWQWHLRQMAASAPAPVGLELGAEVTRIRCLLARALSLLVVQRARFAARRAHALAVLLWRELLGGSSEIREARHPRFSFERFVAWISASEQTTVGNGHEVGAQLESSRLSALGGTPRTAGAASGFRTCVSWAPAPAPRSKELQDGTVLYILPPDS